MRTGTAALVLVASPLAAAAAEPPFAWPGGARAAVVLSYDDGMDSHLDHAVLPGQSESLARRLGEWRALATRGHELANHALFHPCVRAPASQPVRDWVRPEYALESYTLERIRDEVALMNTMLLALDGETRRTLAYNCSETEAGGKSYVEAVRPLLLAARAGEGRIASDLAALDPLLVPSWAAEGVTGSELVAFAQRALEANGLAVFQFHGVGGQWISVSREAHRELVAWLAAKRPAVWTDTFRAVMMHVTAEQQRLAAPR